MQFDKTQVVKFLVMRSFAAKLGSPVSPMENALDAVQDHIVAGMDVATILKHVMLKIINVSGRQLSISKYIAVQSGSIWILGVCLCLVIFSFS